MRKVLLLFSLLFFYNLPSFAQTYERLNIPFIVDGEELLNPLTGGLNSPQYNAVDLNNDGTLDLHIFDRIGNQQLTFLNEGTEGNSLYVYAPEFEGNFPKISNWMLLRDFNKDGIMDIFAYSDVPGIDGIRVHTGYYDGDMIAFDRVAFADDPYPLIFFPLSNGGVTQLFVSKIDYPAVDDIDCDGDLDILTFNIGGGYVEWYKNRSIEMGYGTDSLEFRLEETCWGGFFESGIAPEVEFSCEPGGCAPCLDDDDEIQFRHAGSTLLTLDIDNDSDKEIILGDLNFPSLNIVYNEGDCEEAWMNDQDVNFPQESNPVHLPNFPASFFLDLNNDGVKDMMAAPNQSNNTEDKENGWFYENIGSNELPEFELRQTDFLVETMIDLGSGANPAFVDYNADGLLDLVVGNFNRFQPFGEKDARLVLFENKGTEEAPSFELVNNDYLSMNQFSQNSFTFNPTFGDMDDDGDLDILVGEEYGQLFFAENTAGPGNPFSFGPWQYSYMDIDVGLVSVPQIIDLNQDGLNDLVIGERNGNINYFQNVGSEGNPDFISDQDMAPNSSFLGLVDTRIPPFTTGYSAPFFYLENNQLKMITGSEIGRIEAYENIYGNIGGEWTLTNDSLGQVTAGDRTRPVLADIDNDGTMDLFVGNERGGLTAFRTDIAAMPVSTEDLLNSAVRLFPNPASDMVYIKGLDTSTRLILHNAAGQFILSKNLQVGTMNQVSIKGLIPGIYFVQLVTGEDSQIIKLVIN